MSKEFGFQECSNCNSLETSMTGFDGDEGIEFWQCRMCGESFQQEQLVIPSCKAFLEAFWAEHEGLSARGRLEAKKYVRAIQKAEEKQRGRGGMFYEK